MKHVVDGLHHLVLEKAKSGNVQSSSLKMERAETKTRPTSSFGSFYEYLYI